MENALQLDSNIIYQTKANIILLGRAIAVDLSDANIPHSQEIKPHMVLIFKNPKYTNNDLNEVIQVKKAFLGNKEELMTFKLPKMMGPTSAVIEGQLYDFCIYVRDQCKHLLKDEQRNPYVQIKLNRTDDVVINQIINLDPDKIYQTKANLRILGKAIVVDLLDANIPHDKGIIVHMTLIFKSSGCNNQELAIVQNAKEQYIKGKSDYITFKLPKMWGKSSAIIEGQLYDFCYYIREQCKNLIQDEQRIPHTVIKNSGKH